jgi:hypothetical protein
MDDLSPTRAAEIFCARSLGIRMEFSKSSATKPIRRSGKVEKTAAIH